MKVPDLRDLHSVRQALGKSQSELACLLGISTRAIQSYEQGWRPTPAYVQKLAGLLLFRQWQKSHAPVAPCWQVKGCAGERRDTCPAWEFQCGDVCWLVSGGRCVRGPDTSWDEKLAACRKCTVMRQWLTA